MQLTRETLSIPNPDGNSLRINYRMDRIYDAETLYEMIARVSPVNAPQMLQSFTVALKDLGDHLGDLTWRESIAKRKVRERRAILLIEMVPVRLVEKKLSNNDSHREALVDSDPLYNELMSVQDEIEASFILVREKYRTCENAINNVKKLLDNLQYGQNPELVTHARMSTIVEEVPVSDGSTMKIGRFSA